MRRVIYRVSLRNAMLVCCVLLCHSYSCERHFRVARKIPIVCGNIIYSYTVPNLQPQLYQQRHEGNAGGVGAASKLDSSLHLRRRHHRFSTRQ